MQEFQATKDYALFLDNTQNTHLKRDLFHLPCYNDKLGIYLCGNSLGLQPKSTQSTIEQELKVWAERGVVGHFDHPHNRPWALVDDLVIKESAKIVGALESEVAIMNSLTTNLHLLMISFYQPSATRYKILMEGKAFPSDYFAIESQVKLHGLNPTDSIIELNPRPGEHCLQLNDILDTIDKHGDEIALVLFSGVQYYTGQFFDIPTITTKAHLKGCKVGFDLAHAVGNVPLQLHEWNVDFACWCTYKYLNSGPGNIGGAFVHSKYAHVPMPKLTGWWGVDPKSKFDMDHDFKEIPGAASYRLSNPCVLSVMSLYASLQIFGLTTMHQLRHRSKLLTGYMEYLVKTMIPQVTIITPADPDSRGCQLSLLFKDKQMMHVFNGLMKQGIVVDERKPNVLRVSPAPLYNTFEEVYECIVAIKDLLTKQ